MSKVHRLKIWPEYFQAVVSGKKTFEVRYNDRDFRINDTLILEEYEPHSNTFTGNTVKVRVSYILYGDDEGPFGLASGYCIMGIYRI